MSVIKTERGWAELGATQAYETEGSRLERFTPNMIAPGTLMLNKVRLPLHHDRVMADTSWTPAQIRAWNIRLANKVGVQHCTPPCRCPDRCSCALVHHTHKIDMSTLPAGVAVFGRFTEWVI